MKTSLKLLLASCTLSILAACSNNSATESAVVTTTAPTSLTGSPLGNAPSAVAQAVDAYTPTASAQQSASPMKARDLSAAPTATNIPLGAPLASMAAAAKANSLDGKPLQIGFDRVVAQTSTGSATQQVLKWQTWESGVQVAAVNFNSAGAKGMRVGLLVNQLPTSATLRFYAKGAATAFEVKGAEIASILAANLAAGDKTDAGRTYWGPVIDGTDTTLEIELPLGVSANAVDVSVPAISHMFMSLKEGSAIAPLATYTNFPNDIDSLSCQVDVSCAATLPAASNAVVWLVFQVSGGTGICSGTLLNNTANNSIPYVITANHCISNQTVASTLYSETRYKSDSCNSLNGNYFPTSTTSAALLYTAYNTDSTLLRLNGTPAAGVLFAGWDATTVTATNTTISGIHHPGGDSQRLSRGVVSGYSRRDAVNPNFFPAATAATSTILDVNLTTGIVQPGSSGSGLFKGTDANPQLIGTLFGGQAATCVSPGSTLSNPQFTVYGRFDVAFKAGMSTWLSPAAPAPNPNRQPVYRFFNKQLNTYFYTIYPTERDSILATLSNVLVYEGLAFYTSPSAASGFSPVYRFRNNINGAYLYTISVTEYNSILANYPQFIYEGIAWYAEPSSAAGGLPLYRFLTSTSHIYTAYESERLAIIANYPSFKFEGTSYYIRQTP
jgi:lysyl endopeptidase